MPYIERNKKKKIVIVSALPQYKDQENLSKDDPEVIDFFAANQVVSADDKIDSIKSEIDKIFTGANTIALLRKAGKQAFKLILPYILR